MTDTILDAEAAGTGHHGEIGQETDQETDPGAVKEEAGIELAHVAEVPVEVLQGLCLCSINFAVDNHHQIYYRGRGRSYSRSHSRSSRHSRYRSPSRYVVQPIQLDTF